MGRNILRAQRLSLSSQSRACAGNRPLSGTGRVWTTLARWVNSFGPRVKTVFSRWWFSTDISHLPLRAVQQLPKLDKTEGYVRDNATFSTEAELFSPVAYVQTGFFWSITFNISCTVIIFYVLTHASAFRMSRWGNYADVWESIFQRSL